MDDIYSNHFLSSRPRSPFRKHPRAVRMTPELCEVFAANKLTTSTADEVVSVEEFAPVDAPQVLQERFGVRLTEADRALMVGRIVAMAGQPGHDSPADRLG